MRCVLDGVAAGQLHVASSVSVGLAPSDSFVIPVALFSFCLLIILMSVN